MLLRVLRVIHIGFHNILSCHYYFPLMEVHKLVMDPNIPAVRLLLPSLFISKLNPGWTLQGSWMVEWHYTCSRGPDWKHVEVKSLRRYPRHVRESQHQQHQGFSWDDISSFLTPLCSCVEPKER